MKYTEVEETPTCRGIPMLSGRGDNMVLDGGQNNVHISTSRDRFTSSPEWDHVSNSI